MNIKEIFLKYGKFESISFFKEKFKLNSFYFENQLFEHLKNPNLKTVVFEETFQKMKNEIFIYEKMGIDFLKKIKNIPDPSISFIMLYILGTIISIYIFLFTNDITISILSLITGMGIFIFCIRRILKIFGNHLYDELNKLYYKIEYEQFKKIQFYSNQLNKLKISEKSIDTTN